MKKILIPLLLIIAACACKKESGVSESLTIVPPCTGNTWSLTPNYPFGIEPNPIYAGNIRFVCNNKLYVVNAFKSRVYIYDGVTWTWVNSSYPVNFNLAYAVTFSVGDKGYVVEGSATDHRLWEYATTTNTWTQKKTFPGPNRSLAATFSIGNYGYVFGGKYADKFRRDLWKYNTLTDEWSQGADLPGNSSGRANATGFTINDIGYIVGGYKEIYGVSYTLFNDLFVYNPLFNEWSQLADYPGIMGEDIASFVIGTSAFVTMNRYNFYKYSQSDNSWTSIASYPGQPFFRNATVSLNSKGYLLSDEEMYKYTPKFCFGVGAIQ